MKQRDPKIREDGRGWHLDAKVVGRPVPFDPAKALEWNRQMLRLSPNAGRRFPRGAYCFKTWEELEKWETIHKNRQT